MKHSIKSWTPVMLAAAAIMAVGAPATAGVWTDNLGGYISDSFNTPARSSSLVFTTPDRNFTRLHTLLGDPRFVRMHRRGRPAHSSPPTQPGSNLTVTGNTVTGSTDTQTVPTVTVPEPSTLALLGIGLIGTGIAARRRRKIR